jgi:hypothetical protein
MAANSKEHVYKPAWFCIYCSDGLIKQTTKHKLGAEHIIPFGLGGIQILPRASCKRCANLTSAVEQSCLRMMFGTTRIRLGLPTRNPEERPTELTLVLSQETTPIGELKVSASEFPLIVPGLKLPPPGILLSEKPHDRLVGEFVLIQNEAEVKKYLTENGKGIRVATFNNHIFMQMLAKIAHSYAVAEWEIHSFRPLLLDLILGRSQTASYWVGGSERALPPDHHSSLHRLELRREVLLATTYVVAYIRLFCNFGAPEYRVVVGTWNGERD